MIHILLYCLKNHACMADQSIVAIKYDPTLTCGEGFIEGSDLCRFAEVFRNPHSVQCFPHSLAFPPT